MSVAPGDRLAPFALPDPSGVVRPWAPGRVSVVCVVALWCETWRVQLARLASARRALAGLPVEFVCVSVDGRWVEKGDATALGPILRDTDGAWSRGLGIGAVPFTLVVDASGIVRDARPGIGRASELSAQVRAALTPSAATDRAAWLTFDDFPQADDDLLLDLLRRDSVAAAFFCLGARLSDPTRAALARRALAEGHALQVHGWEHDAAHPEVARCAAAPRRLGASPTLFRPPGRSDLFGLDGCPRPLPTVAPYDDARPGLDELRRRLTSGLRAGVVVQLHAGVADTRAVLPEIVAGWRRRGGRWAPLV